MVMIGWYEILQDFQTLIAALVALCAAIIAFSSAQLVARTQSRTARETTERQIAHALAKEDEHELKRRSAFMAVLSSRFRALNMAFHDRLNALNGFREFVKVDDDGVYITTHAGLHWTRISALKPLREESWFASLKWEDVSMLDAPNQTLLNLIMVRIDDVDKIFATICELARDHAIAMDGILLSAIEILQRAIETLGNTEIKMGASFLELVAETTILSRKLRGAD